VHLLKGDLKTYACTFIVRSYSTEIQNVAGRYKHPILILPNVEFMDMEQAEITLILAMQIGHMT